MRDGTERQNAVGTGRAVDAPRAHRDAVAQRQSRQSVPGPHAVLAVPRHRGAPRSSPAPLGSGAAAAGSCSPAPFGSYDGTATQNYSSRRAPRLRAPHWSHAGRDGTGSAEAGVGRSPWRRRSGGGGRDVLQTGRGRRGAAGRAAEEARGGSVGELHPGGRSAAAEEREVRVHAVPAPPHLRHAAGAGGAPRGEETPEQSAELLRRRPRAGSAAPGGGGGRGAVPPSPTHAGRPRAPPRGPTRLPGPAVGRDPQDRPERAAARRSVQQLLPQDAGGWKRCRGGKDPCGAERCPDGPGGARGCDGEHCGSSARDSGGGGFHTHGAERSEEGSAIAAPKQTRTHQPHAAPGAAAHPTAAELRLDPGPLREMGEG